LVKKQGSPWEFPDAVRLPYMPEGRGFDEYFCGVRATRPCRINFSLDGSEVHPEGVWTTPGGTRTQVHSKAALTFIDRRKLDEPFFLYLSYSIPHVPLEASEELLARFPGEMPQRRRYALAMISEMDDGVGKIVDLLKRRGQYDNTLFFFASDNGAPLKLNMPDTKPPTLGGPTWTGSRNDPFSGEKGMLAEGGIRVPLLITWKKHLPARTVYDQPVITLDIAATALAAAGISSPAQLDGVDLLPFLKGDNKGSPHQTLFWRFWSQAAVREGDWKYLQAGPDKAYLFNLKDDPKERVNLLYQHSEKAASLAKAAGQWAAEMRPPGLPDKPLKASEQNWYRYHLDRPGSTPAKPNAAADKELPNFLFITWEDVSPRMGCYGDHAAPEPPYLFAHRDRVNSAYAFRRSVRDRRWHYIRNYRPDLAPHPPVRGHVHAPILIDASRLKDEGRFTGPGAVWLEDRGQPEQLYDTENDPHCVRNLATDPEHRVKLEEMRSAPRDWQVPEHDLGFVPESLMIQRARRLGYPAKLYRHTDTPFTRLYDLARAWQKGDTGRAQIMKSLSAVDAADRYWAVLGAGHLESVEPAMMENLKTRLDDDAGVVARAATWTLHRLGVTNDKTLAPLQKVLRKGNYAERLDAIQIARRIGPEATSLIPELERLAGLKGGSYYDGYLPSAAEFALPAIRSEATGN
jgi:arylsulfatase A-like enzyme